MEDDVGYGAFKILPHKRLKLIGGSISSYWSILNYPERIDMIKQANKLSSFIGDI